MTRDAVVTLLPLVLAVAAFFLLVADPGVEGASSRVAFVLLAVAFALLLTGISRLL